MHSTLPAEADAVVVGAGPNGLVAANRLADAGWEVLVLEAQRTPGGAVRSDREVHPDFVTDTFSAFYPMAAVSPALARLELDRHGLVWSHAPAVLGHPRADGSWALLHRDRDLTAALLDAEHAGDGDAWLTLCRRWDRFGPALVRAILEPFPPLRAGAALAGRLPRAGGLDLVRLLLTPADDLGPEFGGDAARLLLTGNALHADLPLRGAGSGLIGLLLTMIGQTSGFPVPVGGAGALTDALVTRLGLAGGRLICDAPVEGIVVRGGRASAVRCGGQEVRVRRAVLADVGVDQLYGRLLGPDAAPRAAAAARRFRRDPATVKVDFALAGPVPWASPPAHRPGTVHLVESRSDLLRYEAQVAAGLLPDRPFLLVGQMSTADPTRSPAGTESLWAYTHVPQRVTGDAGGGLTGDWTAAESEQFADRIQAVLERWAPGFGSRLLARRVLSPRELEARDANLVGGAVNGGSAALDQQLLFRPVPGAGRAATPVPGLYLASASAHPGGSVHGACGMNAARAALARDRMRVRVGRPGRSSPPGLRADIV